MTTTAAPALAITPKTYIGSEETTVAKSLLQKIAIFSALLGSGLLLASFFTTIPLLLGVSVTALSIYALHYISNIDEKLCDAAFNGNRCMVKFLLLVGANPNEKPGDSALVNAASEGHLQITRDLLSAGADPNMLWSISPLMQAASHGYDEIARELLAANADVNLKNTSNETALKFAIHESQDKVVEVLLEAGADPTIKTRGISPEYTPAEWAQERQAMYIQTSYDTYSFNDTRTREEIAAAANRIVQLLEDLEN